MSISNETALLMVSATAPPFRELEELHEIQSCEQYMGQTRWSEKRKNFFYMPRLGEKMSCSLAAWLHPDEDRKNTASSHQPVGGGSTLPSMLIMLEMVIVFVCFHLENPLEQLMRFLSISWDWLMSLTILLGCNLKICWAHPWYDGLFPNSLSSAH